MRARAPSVDSFIGRGGRRRRQLIVLSGEEGEHSQLVVLSGGLFLLSPCVMNQGSEESRLKMWLLMPRKRAFFECFPYVCPEPVLVKR
jgi:hypothetical protein